MRRAALEGARVILGSATPSIETWAAAERGAIRLIGLPDRINARPLPRVDVIDLRIAAGRRPVAGVGWSSGAVAWSEELDRAVAGALARGEQAMLLLNR